MLRKVVFFVSAIHVVAIVIMGVLLFRASPGPQSQDIFGVGIGNYERDDHIAYFSGRRLNCTPITQPAQYTSTCRVEIAGKLLEISARRNPPEHPIELGGECAAWYDGKTWPCKIGGRHIGTYWFAYLDPPLGLDAQQLEALPRQHPIENLPEHVFLRGGVIVVAITTVLGLLCTVAWAWPRIKNKWLVGPVALMAGATFFIGSCLLVARFTRGFWD